jgi:putative hydrolase of the HAD superfamily
VEPPFQPQAVIFDFGMVLSEPQSQACIDEMAGLLDASVPAFQQAYWHDRHAYDLGRMHGPAYWQGIGHALERELDTSRVEQLIDLDIRSWMRIDIQMLEWARSVRSAGVRTAILSNMPPEHRQWISTQSGWLEDFDFATFSCDLGIGKPERPIYEHCLGGLDTPAAQTLFFDDLERNIAGAQGIGIHAVRFTSPGETLAGIHERYCLPPWHAC